MSNSIEFEVKLKPHQLNDVLKEFSIAQAQVILHFHLHKNVLIEKLNNKNGVLSFVQDAIKLNLGESISLSHVIYGKKYLIKAKIQSKSNNEYTLEPNLEVFEVQRRDNFRITLVGPTKIVIHILGLNEAEVDFKTNVINISLGGSLIELDQVHPDIKAGALIRGTIKADGYKAIDFEAQVRRSEVKKIAGITTQLLGLQFEGIQGPRLALLNEIVLKCSRESSRAQNS